MHNNYDSGPHDFPSFITAHASFLSDTETRLAELNPGAGDARRIEYGLCQSTSGHAGRDRARSASETGYLHYSGPHIKQQGTHPHSVPAQMERTRLPYRFF